MGHPGKNIRLQGSAITNVGQVRTHNEDNVHLWSGNDDLLLAIVADGMGGAAAGEEASRIAVETIASKLGMNEIGVVKSDLDIPESLLRSAVKDANLMIMQEAVEHPSNKGMGTTVTMAFIQGQEARFAHVGDSRAYRVDKHGDIEQITSDHSFVQALVEAQHITPEQAENHPMRNVLYRALGQTPDLDVDTYHTFLRSGDRLVLCSDGLTGHVTASEIAKIASASNNPSDISQELIALANRRGGEDNISVITIIVDIVGESEEAMLDHLQDDPRDIDTAILRDPDQFPHRRPPKPDSLPPSDMPSSRDAHAGREPQDRSISLDQREGHRNARASLSVHVGERYSGPDHSTPPR
jgi:serine/threonine protein phosphatase PrpC